MSQLPFLPGYNGQTIQELIALKGQYRVDSLVLAVEEAVEAKLRSQLSTAEALVLAVESLEREVMNGGFSQYFFNRSHAFAPVIVVALTIINCPQAADIVERAIAVLDVPNLSDSDAIRSASKDESKFKAWEELDQEFFKYPDDIALKLWEFIESRQDKIKIPE